ncbi:hypothetical protein SO802_010832 [Lithocarpus litseifolius]|uniref:Uncharacterized protein n=1 Tax=Lithocarpus litseifolius TaxID=425828 RepID=A0AAW2DFA6_9ROSI
MGLLRRRRNRTSLKLRRSFGSNSDGKEREAWPCVDWYRAAQELSLLTEPSVLLHKPSSPPRQSSPSRATQVVTIKPSPDRFISDLRILIQACDLGLRSTTSRDLGLQSKLSPDLSFFFSPIGSLFWIFCVASERERARLDLHVGEENRGFEK